ncbi:hypothetical protein ACWCXB_34190 [Streptomyces sp. NPDC001514]
MIFWLANLRVLIVGGVLVAIGRRVLSQSGAMMRAVTLGPRPAPGCATTSHRSSWASSPVRDAIAGSFAGVTLRYPRRHSRHPLVGTRAAEVPLAEGRLTELQRRPGFLLVREHDAHHLDTTAPQARRTDPGPALLVRPGSYIAWAGPSSHTTGPDGRRAAWHTWTATTTSPTPGRGSPALRQARSG